MENICEFCGQVMTHPEAVCNCAGAVEARERKLKIESAAERIDQLFGREAETFGFEPIEDQDVIEQMKSAAALLAAQRIRSITIVMGKTTARLSSGTKGNITVERGYAKKYRLED